LANGNFTGFKINATGASAMYIVLFAALYLKANFITDNIDQVKILQDRINNSPWKVECNVKLMLDSTHEADDPAYEKIINQDSIVCYPKTLKCDLATKEIIFYVDNDVVESEKGNFSGMLVLNNGFGSAKFNVDSTERDVENRIIRVNSVLMKQNSNNYKNLKTSTNQIQMITSSNALKTPPAVHGIKSNAPKIKL